MTVSPLPLEKLYRTCDSELIDFKSTSDLKGMQTPLGQERALSAIDFCINVSSDGYNLFCVGPEGTGKTSLIKHQLLEAAKKMPAPDDWCYVNNFEEPHKPKALRLPAGEGVLFAKDIEKLLEDLQIVIPSAFEGEEYRTRLKVIEEHFNEQKTSYFNELQMKTTGKRVSVLRMPVGLVVAPTKDGEVITPEVFDKLPEEERAEILKDLNATQKELEVAVRDTPKWEKEQREEISNLNAEVADFAVSHLIGTLKTKYRGLKQVIAYLTELQEDIINNVELFFNPEDISDSEEKEDDESGQFSPYSSSNFNMVKKLSDGPLRRYCVNVMVKNDKKAGAPVIFVDNPTLPNLVGRMERLQQAGSVIMDFNLLRPGALHQANGGFLIMDARDIISHMPAWEALKRSLRSKKIAMDPPGEESSVISTVILNPESIDLDIKVILIGEPDLYHILSENDMEFPELFKIEAHFSSIMPRTPENITKYANLIADLVREKKLRALNRSAVARVIEYSSRMAGDSEKLSTYVSRISDLLKEADYFARSSNSNSIGRNHVEQAIEAKDNRADLLREMMTEQIKRGTIMIESRGKEIGQINGLVVYEFAHFSFGRPSRITAQVRIGKGEVIDIEREVELGGPSHTKGVLILSSFLASRFAKEFPLSLEGSLVFEQSYGEVDGDSASSAELYALLSAISEVPIRQDLAVTGSVNQLGQVQAIGGVNEKIEGFFDICKMQGLTGTQGVLIPKSNVSNLMLRGDVLEAVKAGNFNVYPITTIDEGLELLTGIPSGVMDKDGNYPAGSLNRKVQLKLKDFYLKSLNGGGSAFEGKEGR